MKHSVFFGDGTTYPYGRKMGMFRGVNTWEDWHLIPAAKPIIATPEVYTNYVDLPAAHGKLDLSEYLTGGPVYKNRSGSLEFFMASGYGFWAERLNQICNMLHGKKLYMVLDDEPEYFYHGRFSVQQPKSDSGDGRDSLTINYELDPFKFILPRSSLDEYWDRFLFEDTHGYDFMSKIEASDSPTFTIPGYMNVYLLDDSMDVATHEVQMQMHGDSIVINIADGGSSVIVPGYDNGFMIDGYIDDESRFPASVNVTLNNQTVTFTRANAQSPTQKSGSFSPVTNSMNTIKITGTGLINLVCWGGHL